VAGIASVVREAYPDPTAFDATHEHYDPKSDPQKPTWYMVDVQFVEKFSQLLTLSQLRACDALSQMVVLQRGSRLSVQPVSAEHFKAVLKLAKSAKSAMR
jgi:predicted RNA-binding protein with PUA-like domain